ncbi:MAG: glycosyltransferase [Methylovulum sp.]|nr:glycosyltransferase [Methylovulum sp.]
MNSVCNTPLVSTIALCYNQAKFAVETLESIRNQSYQNIELIIMDDCSTDNSVEIIENWIQETKYPCIFIKHDKNAGICKTLNEAFSHCQGDYLQIIACDDIMLPEKTTIQVTLLNEQPDNVAVVYSDAYLIKDDGLPHYGWFIQQRRQFIDVPSGDIYNDLLKGTFIPAMSTLIKTAIIKELKGWDENLAYEDQDMWLRISKKYKFTFSAIPSVKYRLHTNNTTKKLAGVRGMETQFWIYKKHIDNNIGLDRFRQLFHCLYANNQATKIHKNEYIKVFPNELSSKLIALNLPYWAYNSIRTIKNIIVNAKN